MPKIKIYHKGKGVDSDSTMHFNSDKELIDLYRLESGDQYVSDITLGDIAEYFFGDQGGYEYENI